MPENTLPNTPQWAAPAPANHISQAQKAVAVAVGASAILTAGWGLLSGLTGRHFTLVLPVIGAVIAAALTSTPARRPPEPAPRSDADPRGERRALGVLPRLGGHRLRRDRGAAKGRPTHAESAGPR